MMLSTSRKRGSWTAVLGLALVVSGLSAISASGQVANSDPKRTGPSPVIQIEQHDAVFDNYRFRNGESLPSVRIHYSTAGTAKRDASGAVVNAVLLLHWTGTSSAVMQSPAFLESLFASGQPLDASKYFLIFPDNIGHGASSKPSDGLRSKFPGYGYGDMVDLQHKLTTEILGVKRLHAILGLSMGGMNAWQWAETYPQAVRGVMPVVAHPAALSGRNLLWRRIVTNAIRNDIEWHDGNYDKPLAGWANSRPLYQMMLDGVPRLAATVSSAVEADRYIKTAIDAAKLRDANDMLYALEAAADYDPESALGSIRAEVYALNFSDDEFYPEQSYVLERLMREVPRGQYAIQKGSKESFGHLTMAHPELWKQHVRIFMDSLESAKD
jgi:homoserine O-acetyltransferase/O-succinyltransferase